MGARSSQEENRARDKHAYTMTQEGKKMAVLSLNGALGLWVDGVGVSGEAAQGN